jgi:hypothetical protein
MADLEFYPGDAKPLDSPEENEALRGAVLDWMDEHEEYVYIEQLTTVSQLSTAL